MSRTRRVLRHDADGVLELREHLQASARQFQSALDRLIRVGHGADRHRLRLPFF